MESLQKLAEQEVCRPPPYFLYRSSTNWAPSLVEKLTDYLKNINSKQSLLEELPFIIVLCQDYKQNPEVNLAGLKVLGIISLAAVGALMGLPLGIVFGAVLAVLYLVEFCYSARNPLFLVFGISAMPAVGLLFGCISGVILGTYAGMEVGYKLTATDYAAISNTLVFQKEHEELSSASLTIEKTANQILKVNEMSFQISEEGNSFVMS